MARGRSFSIRPRWRGFTLPRQVARHLVRRWRVMARHLARVTRPRCRRSVIGWPMRNGARRWPRRWPMSGRRLWPMRASLLPICGGFCRLHRFRVHGGDFGSGDYCFSIRRIRAINWLPAEMSVWRWDRHRPGRKNPVGSFSFRKVNRCLILFRRVPPFLTVSPMIIMASSCASAGIGGWPRRQAAMAIRCIAALKRRRAGAGLFPAAVVQRRCPRSRPNMGKRLTAWRRFAPLCRIGRICSAFRFLGRNIASFRAWLVGVCLTVGASLTWRRKLAFRWRVSISGCGAAGLWIARPRNRCGRGFGGVSILRPGSAVLRIVQGVGRLRPGSPRRSAGRCAFGWFVVSAGAAGP